MYLVEKTSNQNEQYLQQIIANARLAHEFSAPAYRAVHHGRRRKEARQEEAVHAKAAPFGAVEARVQHDDARCEAHCGDLLY